MLVSHRFKFVYLKTRKTAGSSVAMFLEPYCTPENMLPPPLSAVRPVVESTAGIIGFHEPPSTQAHAWWNHMPATLVKEKLGLNWDKYTKVCCVRNPFDKVFSFFWWQNSKFIAENLSKDAIKKRFQAFVKADQDLARDRYMYSLDNEKPSLDVYIRFEHLTSGLDDFCTRVGILEKVVPLSWTKGETRPRNLVYQEFYDEQTVDIVRQAYDAEFGWFGYSKNFGE